ncbi:MAG: hypothetical protein AVDCRST_MAG32-2992 [uncultured Nocardioides sp.]|uniref:DUF2867 domain-containing protein n=1 Tax=uncultured Nocardioides sp. TaxID=198441 RepID=A0A6J4NZ26_9ACTN|nr:MAG: hypothetical protein AVDCRST_MAG32-2992 [uncultured Nocardioides sp.]
MRIASREHTDRPWRIHEIAPDFELEDVWALPTPGGRAGEFRDLVASMAGGDPAETANPLVRLVWAVRWRLGEWCGWDDPETGLGSRVPSLRDRLPDDLLAAPAGPTSDASPFEPLYLLDDEYAAEIANQTMHGVLHLGWVPDGVGGYRGQMAVLVKPNGLSGRIYMAAIRPFRHLLVYPALMRRIEREWEARESAVRR